MTEPRFSLRGHRAAVTSVAISNEFLFSGDANGNILQWELSSRRSVKQVKAHQGTGGIIKLAVFKNHLYSQGRDGKLLIWNLSLELEKSIPCYALNFCGFNVSPDGILLATENSNIDLYDSRTEKYSNFSQCESGMCMALERVDESVIAGYEDGSLIRWKDGDELLHLFKTPILALDARNTLIAASSANGELVLIENDSKRVARLPVAAQSVRIHPTKNICLVGLWNGTVGIVPFSQGKAQLFPEHRGSIRCVEWLSDGFVDPAQPMGGLGRVIQITSITDYCMFLPPSGGSIAESEGYPLAPPEIANKWAVSYCTQPNSKAPGAKIFPPGLITGAHFQKTDSTISITGTFNASLLNITLDGGGYYDLDDNVNSPPGGICADYDSFYNFVGPIDGIYCIKCCKSIRGCNIQDGEKGCSIMVPGNYSVGFDNGIVLPSNIGTVTTTRPSETGKSQPESKPGNGAATFRTLGLLAVFFVWI